MVVNQTSALHLRQGADLVAKSFLVCYLLQGFLLEGLQTGTISIVIANNY